MKPNNPTHPIQNLEDLAREQRRVRALLRIQEEELRGRVRQMPGELFYSGVNSLVPPLLAGKITSSVLNTGRSLVNHIFTGKEPEKSDGKLIAGLKQVGIFSLLRLAYRAFISKK